MNKCKHENVTKMWFEESYGFIGYMIVQCKGCGQRISSQWYQSNDCGEHWFKIDSPMEE